MSLPASRGVQDEVGFRALQRAISSRLEDFEADHFIGVVL